MAAAAEGRKGADAADDSAGAASVAVGDAAVGAVVSDGAGAGAGGNGGVGVGVGNGVICVVDFPPAAMMHPHPAGSSGGSTALWRRLLLGEGDGGATRGSNQGQGQGAYYSVGSILGYGISTFLGNSSNSNSNSSHDGSGDGSSISNDGGTSNPNPAPDSYGEESYSAHCDPQSLFADAEKMALLEVTSSDNTPSHNYHSPSPPPQSYLFLSFTLKPLPIILTYPSLHPALRTSRALRCD